MPPFSFSGEFNTWSNIPAVVKGHSFPASELPLAHGKCRGERTILETIIMAGRFL